jgi:hypothetical protein
MTTYHKLSQIIANALLDVLRLTVDSTDEQAKLLFDVLKSYNFNNAKCGFEWAECCALEVNTVTGKYMWGDPEKLRIAFSKAWELYSNFRCSIDE